MDTEEEENDTLSSLDVPPQLIAPSLSTGGARRSAARKAYAGSSGRGLSTSAAKRQSVMALGSIKHLQHMYAKNGLASSTPLSIGSSGQTLPLALPGQVLPNHNILESPEEDLPPSPSPPPQNLNKSFEVEVPSSRLQRQAVYRELAEVCEKWGLVEMDKFTSSRRVPSTASTSHTLSDTDTREISTPSSMPPDSQQDNLILDLINTTTSAIRAAQKYFLTLPPEKLPYGSTYMTSSHKKETSHQSGRGPPSSLGIITASRPIPRHSMMGVASSSKRTVSPVRGKDASIDTTQDPLLRLRKASLATLGALKEMEARYRLPTTEEASVEHVSDALHDLSFSSSSESAHNHPSLCIDDTSSSEVSTSSSTNSRGHLYQANVSLVDLSKEAQVVKKWIETVDNLLSDLTTGAKTPRPRTKSGNLSIETSSIPKWARLDAFEDEKLGRLRACLDSHLPRELEQHLPTSETSSDLFMALSDGQLLCAAYNSVLRASQRPWGFIPENSIHDVISLTRQREEAEQAKADSRRMSFDDNSSSAHLQVGSRGSTLMRRQSSEGMGNESFASSTGGPDGTAPRIGLTFRRFENLRVFVAALKLRYLVHIRSEINVRIIARKEEGWMEMLEEIAVQWVNAAAEEKTNEELDSD